MARRFLFGERGEAVVWLVVAVVGIIFAVIAFLSFRHQGGTVGNEIPGAASNAASGLQQVRIQ